VRIYTIASILALIAGVANAATWERPAGAYTPTNHSVNTTKYQTDRSNGVAISSAKVDGDVNKAFEGLNSLEGRVAPNVVGQGGKFLTNNGSTSSWGLISTTSISTGAAAAGQVLKTNGAGSTVFGLLDTSSFPNNGTAGTYSVPTITVNTAGIITAVTSSNIISGSVVSASLVSASAVSTTSLSVSGTIIDTGMLPIATGYISTTSTGCSILKGNGLSECKRIGVGNFSVSFTTPMPDALYKVSCNLDSYRVASWVATTQFAHPNTTDGFFLSALNGSGSVNFQDGNRFMCVVYP